MSDIEGYEPDDPKAPGHRERMADWADNFNRVERLSALRLADTDPENADREKQARAHFPHLAPHVPPRESDEEPTFWEDQ